MRVAVLSSGGKDSAAAWWWATARWSVEVLFTVTITDGDSPSFQIPSTHVVEQQAALAGLPWVEVKTSGAPPTDIENLESAMKGLDIDGFVSGAPY